MFTYNLQQCQIGQIFNLDLIYSRKKLALCFYSVNTFVIFFSIVVFIILHAILKGFQTGEKLFVCYEEKEIQV